MQKVFLTQLSAEPAAQKRSTVGPRSWPWGYSQVDHQEEKPSLVLHYPELLPLHPTAFLGHHCGEKS